METESGEPIALLHELLGNGCSDDESIFSLLAQLESVVDSGASNRLLQPVKRALTRSRIDRGRILTRYVDAYGRTRVERECTLMAELLAREAQEVRDYLRQAFARAARNALLCLSKRASFG